jgi:hypothetical protein
VFGVWVAIAVARLLGCLLLEGASPEAVAVITAVTIERAG